MLKLLQLIPLLNRLAKLFEDWWHERQKRLYKAEGNQEGRAEAKAEAQARAKEEVAEIKETQKSVQSKTDEEINARLKQGFGD